MEPRERYVATVLHEKPDRVPFFPGRPRRSTLRAWRAQGLPGDAEWYNVLTDSLGIDHPWLYSEESLDVDFRMIPPFEEKILERKDRSLIVQDWKGNVCEISDEFSLEYLREAIDFVTRKWIKCPVEDRDDWEKMNQLPPVFVTRVQLFTSFKMTPPEGDARCPQGLPPDLGYPNVETNCLASSSQRRISLSWDGLARKDPRRACVWERRTMSGRKEKQVLQKIDHVSPNARKYLDEVLGYGFRNTTSRGFVARLEKLFAEKFGMRYAIAHSNGTTTMHSALLAAGVGAGDEVIVPPLTHAATAFVALYVDAVPIFADVDEHTFTIDPQDVRRKITTRTKAVIPVSIYGLSPDLDPIMELARKHHLTVIEDDAQCYLGRYHGRIVGSIGHFASFSFAGSKHMSCGDGGMLVTSDDDLATAARRAASFGYPVSSRPGASALPEAQRCAPDSIRHVSFGHNFRLPELAAAVALAELERLEELVAMRTACAELFSEVVADCPWLVPQRVPAGYVHAYWTYVCKLSEGAPDWRAFRGKFVELGGDGFYGAWRPTYREPFFERLGAEVAAHPERYPQWTGIMPDYRDVRCGVMDRIQPRLAQFKTNCFDLDEARRQADILAETIRAF